MVFPLSVETPNSNKWGSSLAPLLDGTNRSCRLSPAQYFLFQLPTPELFRALALEWQQNPRCIPGSINPEPRQMVAHQWLCGACDDTTWRWLQKEVISVMAMLSRALTVTGCFLTTLFFKNFHFVNVSKHNWVINHNVCLFLWYV